MAADPYFNETIKERLEEGEWKDIPIAFAGKNDDLHFGIGKATANITYAEKKDGVWYVDVAIEDTYNYDEWLDTDFTLPALSDFVDPIPYLKDVGIPVLNNCALAAQYYGSLKPYKVTVNLSLEIPAE